MIIPMLCVTIFVILVVRFLLPMVFFFQAEDGIRDYKVTGVQTCALPISLAQDKRFAVYVGMRHWHPYIRDAVEHIVADGHRRAVGIVLAPHYSAMSVGAYEKKLLEASAGRLDAALVRRWGDHPKFLEAGAGRVAQALQRVPAPDAVHVLFTAHSLPERILATGDRYPDELRASAAAVAQRAGLAAWSFAYQSAGATPEPRRSEEHTSELQSPCNLVCRLLLEKKNYYQSCS